LGRGCPAAGVFISRSGTGEVKKLEALSLGERVSRGGTFISRRGTGGVKKLEALSLGERVSGCRRFHQPERDG
jgi:hypothetical protein